MKVKLRTTMAGPGGVVLAGQVTNLDPDRAKILIDAGYAEPIGPQRRQAPETATAEPPEAAVMPAPERQQVSATSAAEELAEEHGIDLTTVQGTGAGGNVLKSDVERVIAELDDGDDEEE